LISKVIAFELLAFRFLQRATSNAAGRRSIRSRFFLLPTLLLGISLIPGCGGDEGLERFPVEGVVTVNGVPAERVVVLLHHTDESTPGNYRYPTAVTSADGTFKISSIGEADGAVKGTYKVTFTWLSSAGLDSIDMFGGSLGDPKSSSFEITVPVPEGQPTKFDLVVPEAQLRKPGQR
jgi:hypothetical protein